MIESQKKLGVAVAELFDATGGSFETMTVKIKTFVNTVLTDLIGQVNKLRTSVDEKRYKVLEQAERDGTITGEKALETNRKSVDTLKGFYGEYQGMDESEAYKAALESRKKDIEKLLSENERFLSEASKDYDRLRIEYGEKDRGKWKEFWKNFLWGGSEAVVGGRDIGVIKGELDDALDKLVKGTGIKASLEKQLQNLSSIGNTGTKKTNDDIKETDEEKEGRIEAEKSLQESRIALMEEGLEKELATIRNGYKRRISEVKGNSSAEIELRRSLQQEMERALSDAAEEYEKNRTDTDLRNRLAIAEEGSEEELSVRLEILEKQKEAEIEAAESNGADISLIEQKYLNEKRKLYEEYAADEVEEIAKSAAAQQVVRNAQYNSEMKEMEKAFASGLIGREEYENRKAEIAEKFSIDTAKAAVDSLEEQLSVENLSADEREAISEKLQKAKEDLANAEADAEIAAIKRVEEEEEDAFERRRKKAEKILQFASDTIGAVDDLMSSLYERDIERLEEQQEANEEAYNAEVERADALAESGAISEEEAEARKRAAEVETSRKNEELEKKKVQLQQKQAKWDKAVQLAQAGIATALAVTRALPNVPLAITVGAMGAVQVALIAATPIPAYKEGTKAGGHVGGLAVVGDGGRPELVVFGGSSWITPDRPTLVDLPKGAEVFPDISDITRWDDVRSDIPYLVNDNSSGTVVVNDYSGLSREMKGLRKDVRMLMKSQHRDARAAQYELYKRTRI